MTTFVQRCIGDVGEGEDGAKINSDQLRACLALYVLGNVNSAWIVSALVLSEGQTTELNEILATKPSGVVESAAWAQRTAAVMIAGASQFDASGTWTGFGSASACRVALGLSV